MVVGELLVSRNLTIASAESCTGGLIAHLITGVPGSSRYFVGSITAYSDEVKEKLLGVSPALIRDRGAVSEEVAKAMATGVRNATGAAIGIASTGIAGPSGATPGKPVGLVYTAYADQSGSVAVKHTFGEGRARIVQRAAFAALETVRRKLLRMD